jgi:hypothetical protein
VLLSSPHEEIQAQVAMVLQNLSKNVDNRYRMVEEGCLPPLIALLWSFNEDVQVRTSDTVVM